MKVRLRLIRAKPNFYIISDNPNVNLGIVDCSLYSHCFALKDDYYKKRKDLLPYAPVEYKYLILRDSGKDIHHTCEAKSILPRKNF